MEVTYLRGACVIIEIAGKRILCDPWLEDGIYYGAWAHYPEWTEQDWKEYKPWDVDYIYVSHIHPDHFDPVTMYELRSEGCYAPVLIHKFPSPFLKKRIEECGFEVIELESGADIPLGSRGHLRIYPADACNPEACGHMFSCVPLVRNTQVDSLAVFSDGHRTVVNVNDCPWGLAHKICDKIAGDYPEITLALIAYAGAGPFPQCFKMSLEDKAKHAEIKKANFTQAAINFAKALKARYILPFAGDYQLCGSLSALNEYRGIPEYAEIHRQLWEVGIFTVRLAPGDSSSPTFPNIHPPVTAERIKYVHEVLANRKLDYEDEPLPQTEELASLAKSAFARFDSKRREYGLRAAGSIYVKTGANSWFVIPPRGEPRFDDKVRDLKYFTVECDPRLLKLLLMGPKYAHWNNAEIGSHLTFDRRDIYEPGLHHMMSFLHV